MKESIDSIRAFIDMLKQAQEQLKEGRPVDYQLKRLDVIMDDLAKQEELDISQFRAVNGRICGKKVHKDLAGYEVVSVADNWPQSHHPVAVGDIVLTDRFMYGKEVGSYAYLKPGDIVAINKRS